MRLWQRPRGKDEHIVEEPRDPARNRGPADARNLPHLGPDPALLVADLLVANDPQKPIVTAYQKAYEDKYKSDISAFGGHAYDGLMLAVNAIKSAGSTDKAKVRDALEATKGYIGTGGIVNMSATDHMGLDLSAFRMLEVKGGDWSLVK